MLIDNSHDNFLLFSSPFLPFCFVQILCCCRCCCCCRCPRDPLFFFHIHTHIHTLLWLLFSSFLSVSLSISFSSVCSVCVSDCLFLILFFARFLSSLLSVGRNRYKGLPIHYINKFIPSLPSLAQLCHEKQSPPTPSLLHLISPLPRADDERGKKMHLSYLSSSPPSLSQLIHPPIIHTHTHTHPLLKATTTVCSTTNTTTSQSASPPPSPPTASRRSAGSSHLPSPHSLLSPWRRRRRKKRQHHATP